LISHRSDCPHRAGSTGQCHTPRKIDNFKGLPMSSTNTSLPWAAVTGLQHQLGRLNRHEIKQTSGCVTVMGHRRATALSETGTTPPLLPSIIAKAHHGKTRRGSGRPDCAAVGDTAHRRLTSCLKHQFGYASSRP
jgi:hypothetical protein